MSNTLKAFKEHRKTDPAFPLNISKVTGAINFPPHYHKQLEVVYCVDGKMTVEVNHTNYQLKAGDIILIGANHIHSYKNHASDGLATYHLMIFDWDYLDAISKDKSTYEDLYPVLLKLNLLSQDSKTSILPKLQELLTSMHQEIFHKCKGYKLIAISHLYEFLTLVTRELEQITTTHQEAKSLQKENTFVSTINDFIYNNYTKELSLDEIALATGYSTYHFTRLFKKYTGFTFKQYLSNFRVNMVKEALYDDSISITDIAFSHGFSSIKSFNRCFKDLTGTSPREFKKAIND